MNYTWIDEYCLSKKGVEKDFKEEWNAFRYMIMGKMFGMQGTDKVGKPIITIKLDPMLSTSLREQYSDIVPGYYMNKTHWSSLYLEGSVPDEILKTMLDNGYDILLRSFSKKRQEEILNE